MQDMQHSTDDLSQPGKQDGSYERLDPGRQSQQALGERILAGAVRLAVDMWGTCLVAAYALGSLAHGGFSVHAVMSIWGSC